MTHPRGSLAIVAGIAFLLVGCDASAPSPASSRPPSTAPSAAIASPASPAPTPTPAPPDPAVRWVSPATDRITDYTANLSVTTGAVNLRRVVFTITWKGGSKTACTSAKPDPAGRWGCTADLLKLGVRPGSIDVAARAFDTNERVIEGASDGRSLTYEVVPPRPGSAKRKVVSETWAADDSSYVEVDRFTWTSPTGYATEFRLYGVSGCPNESPQTNGEPCLVEHTHLDAGMMKLLKKVGGSARSMTLRSEVDTDTCEGPSGYYCSPYRSLVLGAFNAYGHSVYAIVASQEVCLDCYGP
jgi:hypothetical protein